MDRIEFVGASYVGKSTLSREIESLITNNSIVISEKDLVLKARKNIGFFRFRIRKLLEKLLAIINVEYDAYGVPTYESIDADSLLPYSQTLMLCFFEDAQKRFAFKFLLNTQRRLLKKILRLVYYNNIEREKFLLAEESLIHWHLVLHELFLEDKIKLSDKHFEDKGLFPKAIVCCYSTAPVIKERIGLRREDNKINKNHIGYSDEEILQKVLEKQEFFLEYSKLAEKQGVKVLYLDTANKLEHNVEKFQTFLLNF